MKKDQRRDKTAECPFYIKEDRQRTMCEGVEECAALHLVFQTEAQKQAFKRKYCCCGQWRKCRVAKMLTEKWESAEKK